MLFRPSRRAAVRPSSRVQEAARAAVELLEERQLLSVATVNSTADNDSRDTAFTLREAIEYVNGTLAFSSLTAQEQAQVDQSQPLGTNDTIKFNISGAGLHTISVTSNLPTIVKPVLIDGYSQPGSSKNTLAVGDNAVINIALDGSADADVFTDGLFFFIGSGGSKVQGLSVINFSGTGISGAKTNNITIAGNFIGVKADGTTAAANGEGIDMPQLNSSTVGGTTVGDRNIISGNTGDGLSMYATGASQNLVIGNYIGTNAAGTAALANGEDGVDVQYGTNYVLANLISGNTGNGVNIHSAGVVKTTVQGNIIGLDVTGIELGNGENGVNIDDDAAGNLIGGDQAGQGNVISGNVETGVELRTDNNTVQGNLIGLDPTGALDRGNGGDGVGLIFGENNLIGGTTGGARNVISGNAFSGVGLDVFADNTKVQGNYIGTNAAGTAAIGNDGDGVSFNQISGALIGGAVAGAGNLISGNESDGIFLGGSGGGNPNTVIAGNKIGTDYLGTSAIGNLLNGVEFHSGNVSGVLVGGTVGDASNIIAFNTLAGVAVVDSISSSSFTSGNAIRGNSIFSNGGLGIDLETDNSVNVETGVTQNDSLDADDGANQQQNFPVLASANAMASSVTITGLLNSTANTSFLIDFYANDAVDPTGMGEGKRFIGTAIVTTDSLGNATINSTFNVALGADKYITATATTTDRAPYGDTSEFSLAIEATLPLPPPMVSINDVTKNEGDSGTTSFTFTLTRTGDLTNSSTVSISTANGTATAGSDYTAQTNTPVLFAAGSNTATVTIDVKGDTTIESDETFFVNLTSITNATIADGQGLGTITNDDVYVPPPVVVANDPTNPGKKALIVTDSDAGHEIDVVYAGKGKATVWIDEVNKGTYSFTGNVIVYGNGGSDTIWVDPKITVNAYLYGGEGDDWIYAGGGSTIALGGNGADHLYGGGKRDILIGGDGQDYLDGGKDDDVLVNATTTSDDSLSNLLKIQKEWTRTDKNYATRLSDIRNGSGYAGGVKFSETTITADNWNDTLKGNSGTDAFFAATTDGVNRKKDTLSDKSASETTVVATMPIV